MFNKFGACILVIVGTFATVFADTFLECEGKDQTYVAVQEDCSYYIFCHGDESFSESCPEESPYFSIEEQTCDTDSNVCKDRAISNKDSSSENLNINTSSEIFTTSSANSTSTATITIPTAATATDANVEITAASATLETVVPTSSTSVIPSTCPPVDNPNRAIFLSHTKSCSQYFLCYRGQRLTLHCSPLLHFDLRQQRCDYPENVKCHLMNVASPREQCLSHTFDFYPHPSNCNYYYQCILGYLKVMQCPLNMGWHYEKRVCVKQSRAKCYNFSAEIIRYDNRKMQTISLKYKYADRMRPRTITERIMT